MKYSAKKGLVAIIVLTSLTGAAQALKQKGQPDITMVSQTDKAMKIAKITAKKQVGSFLEKLNKPPEGTDFYTVKLKFEDKYGAEFMWLAPIRKRPKNPSYEGILINKPSIVRSVKFKNLVRFRKKDIVDWGYRKNKKWYGQFTTCALFPHMPKQQAAKLRKVYTCSGG